MFKKQENGRTTCRHIFVYDKNFDHKKTAEQKYVLKVFAKLKIIPSDT